MKDRMNDEDEYIKEAIRPAPYAAVRRDFVKKVCELFKLTGHVQRAG